MFSCLEQMDVIKGRKRELLVGMCCQSPKHELQMTSRHKTAGTSDISWLYNVRMQPLKTWRPFCLCAWIHHAALQKELSVPSNKRFKSLKSYQRGSTIKQCKGLTITRTHVHHHQTKNLANLSIDSQKSRKISIN